MSEALEQIRQSPPCTGCFNRHPGGRGQLGKEAVHPVRSVCYPLLRQAPSAVSTAICETRLCKSTPTCTMKPPLRARHGQRR
jgi:hypothetical protein